MDPQEPSGAAVKQQQYAEGGSRHFASSDIALFAVFVTFAWNLLGRDGW